MFSDKLNQDCFNYKIVFHLDAVTPVILTVFVPHKYHCFVKSGIHYMIFKPEHN